jgi:SEC-C motif-containing protein
LAVRWHDAHHPGINMTKKIIDACPCGVGVYAACCGPYHAGTPPVTAEQLMRSRYSAYALGLMDYVYATWHHDTRPPLAELQHDAAVKWLGLEIKQHALQQECATVEFVARTKLDGRAHRLHEVSRFVREEGRWLYIDGSFPERVTP